MKMKILSDKVDGFITFAETELGKAIDHADANGNNRLTRDESRSLGKFRTTYDGYAETGCTVYTEKFHQAAKAHIRMSARSGELSGDLVKTYAEFLTQGACPYANSQIRSIAEHGGFWRMAETKALQRYAVDPETLSEPLKGALLSAGQALVAEQCDDDVQGFEGMCLRGYYAVPGGADYPGTIAYAVIAQGFNEDFNYGLGGMALIKPNGDQISYDVRGETF